MEPILLVGVGGAIGSVLRFKLSKLQPVRGIAAGTALVNIIGSFLFALVAFAPLSPDLGSLIGVGALGGFTTFSTFSFETFRMLEDHDYHTVITNTFINVGGSLAGVYAGYLLVLWLV